jgi:hypothetical protein
MAKPAFGAWQCGAVHRADGIHPFRSETKYARGRSPTPTIERHANDDQPGRGLRDDVHEIVDE